MCFFHSVLVKKIRKDMLHFPKVRDGRDNRNNRTCPLQRHGSRGASQLPLCDVFLCSFGFKSCKENTSTLRLSYALHSSYSTCIISGFLYLSLLAQRHGAQRWVRRLKGDPQVSYSDHPEGLDIIPSAQHTEIQSKLIQSNYCLVW